MKVAPLFDIEHIIIYISVILAILISFALFHNNFIVFVLSLILLYFGFLLLGFGILCNVREYKKK